MRFLSEAEYLQEAEPMLRKVFTDDDPFEPIFVPEVEEKRIMWGYYVDVYELLMNGVCAAATDMGEEGFYYTSIWLKYAEPKSPIRHCYISFAEYNLPGEQQNQDNWNKIEDFDILEYVIYSPTGKWGIMFSHEHHALLGGTRKFIEAIEQSIPDLDFDKQIRDFLDYWQYYNSSGRHTEWILALLTQICGRQKAQNLLNQYNIKLP